MKKKRCKNKLLFTKLQKGNTGVGKIPAMWTILKFIHVEVTDGNICLRMEEKIKLYPKSGTKLHVVFEKYFFFYNCVILLFSFTDIMIESVIMLQIMALSTLGLILWKVRSLSPGPIFPTSKNLTINWKCLGLNVTRQLTWRHMPKLLIQFTKIKIYSFYFKAPERLKEICIIKQQPQKQPPKSHEQHTVQKCLKMGRLDACCWLFCVF